MNIRISNSLQWLWSTPYTSKHLLRRYLDHPKTKAPSTEVFGCLGSVTYKCEHQKNTPPTSQRTLVRFAFFGISCGADFKKNQCLFCFVLVGWLFCFVLFCFFGQSMSCLSKPLKKNTFPEETNQLAIFGFGSSDPPKDPRISDRWSGGERLDHLFKKIVLGVASLGRTVGFFLMQQVYIYRFFVPPEKLRMGFPEKCWKMLYFLFFASCSFAKGTFGKFSGVYPLEEMWATDLLKELSITCNAQPRFFFWSIGSIKNLERSSTLSGKWWWW